MRRLLCVALLCGCPSPSPQPVSGPVAKRAEGKPSSAPSPESAPSAEAASGPSAEAPAQPQPPPGPSLVTAPAAEASASERKQAVLRLLTDGASAAALPQHDVDAGKLFVANLGEQMASGTAGLPQLRAHPPAVEGGLSKEVVHRIIRKDVPTVAACYDIAKRGDDDPNGRLTLKFEIDARGKVSALITQQKGTGLASGLPCVEKIAKGWTFPKPRDGKPVTVANEFALKP